MGSAGRYYSQAVATAHALIAPTSAAPVIDMLLAIWASLRSSAHYARRPGVMTTPFCAKPDRPRAAIAGKFGQGKYVESLAERCGGHLTLANH